MAAVISFGNGVFLPSACGKNRTVNLNPPHLLSRDSVLKLKRRNFSTTIEFNKIRNRGTRSSRPIVFAWQSNFQRVAQTAWKVGKDGVEAGTNLVPDSVPRPIARISVTMIAATLVIFVFKTLLSTVFFVLAVMGLIYFTFIALNKDEGPNVDAGSTSTSTEDSLAEARRIMEKYK